MADLDYSTLNEPDQSRDMDGGKSSSKPGRSLGTGMKAAGKTMQQYGQDKLEGAREQAEANSNRQQPLTIPSYRRGGKVRKTGLARLHKGERVVPRNKVKKVEKAVRQSKRKKGREM